MSSAFGGGLELAKCQGFCVGNDTEDIVVWASGVSLYCGYVCHAVGVGL